MKHEEECFITYPHTEKCVEKTRRSRVFLTHFEVFGYVMKHSSECFILHLKQMRILGENWEESWVNICKFFLTYPNSVSVLISFVFILWIINALYIYIYFKNSKMEARAKKKTLFYDQRSSPQNHAMTQFEYFAVKQCPPWFRQAVTQAVRRVLKWEIFFCKFSVLGIGIFMSFITGNWIFLNATENGKKL